MTRPSSALPFASGLPGDGFSPRHPNDAAPNARGYAMLMAMRERAHTDLRVLAPLIKRRFDGEWIEPDPEDIAAHANAAAIKRLVDAIMSDPTICWWAAARLANLPRVPR